MWWWTDFAGVEFALVGVGKCPCAVLLQEDGCKIEHTTAHPNIFWSGMVWGVCLIRAMRKRGVEWSQHVTSSQPTIPTGVSSLISFGYCALSLYVQEAHRLLVMGHFFCATFGKGGRDNWPSVIGPVGRSNAPSSRTHVVNGLL